MILLSTAYFPPAEYMHYVLCKENMFIEAHENFIKQTWRNRCRIVTANGPLDLSIPLVNEGNKTLITEKKISYAEPWQMKHWRAIESAYNSSPYFEYFEEEIKNLFLKEHEFLFDLNNEALKVVFNILRVDPEIQYTESYSESNDINDLRIAISPKEKSRNDLPAYYQPFSERNGFVANASIIDLLFNEGLGALSYLEQLNF
ncbi:MAG TPA: WbqC family protein [Bacteroidia bacterium]